MTAGQAGRQTYVLIHIPHCTASIADLSIAWQVKSASCHFELVVPGALRTISTLMQGWIISHLMVLVADTACTQDEMCERGTGMTWGRTLLWMLTHCSPPHYTALQNSILSDACQVPGMHRGAITLLITHGHTQREAEPLGGIMAAVTQHNTS